MPDQSAAQNFRISLRAALAGILLLVILPTLGVVAMALRHAGNSVEEISRIQLLETARVLSSSSLAELDSIERLLLAKASLPPELRDTAMNGRNPGVALYEARRATGGSWDIQPPPTAEVAQLLAESIARKARVASNIIDDPDTPERIHLNVAVPVIEDTPDENRISLMVYQAHPADLIRSLQRNVDNGSQVILAITDGNGRLIGRSVGGEKTIGKPVPDWEALKASGTESGIIRAALVDGGRVVFAFQEIPGTPGWMAVTGENESGYDGRWQKPILLMILTSSTTILLGIILAIWLTRMVLAPISGLVERARRVADVQGDNVSGKVAIRPSIVEEFETLRRSLDLAQDEMDRRLEAAQLSERREKDSNRSLRDAERLARIGSWSLDLLTGTFSASEMMNELNGRGPDAPPLPLEELENIVTPADYRRIRDAIGRCIETGEPYGLQAVHLRPDGTSFPVWLQGQARRDEAGNIVGISGSMQDITERNEQNARLSALADNLPRGAIFRLESTDPQQLLVTYISGGIEDLIGLPATEIINEPGALTRSIHADDLGPLQEMLVTAAQPGMQIDQQFRVITTDQRVLWVRARAALRLPTPDHVIWDGVLLDISAERAAADALRHAKLAAETAERAKSDFLATMSHEIRTPMNSVVGMTRLALKTQLDPRQRGYLEKINNSASVLLGIINDILDFSRIEAGGLELEKAAFRIESVLETVASVNSLRAEEKGVELTFNVAADVPPRLYGDSLRLGQVLNNLVSNAIKFTESGDVEVSIRCAQPGMDDCTKLQISVRDTGIGLSQEQISGLFRPFVQAQSDTARIYGGTGLGLAICQRLVGLMNGRISVTSTPGAGSIFSFTADFSAPPDAPEVAPSPRYGLPGLRGRRVLIVDDNATARVALAEMIRGFGMRPDTAAGGAEALALLHDPATQQESYDVILLDWRMPGMDGLELARAIRDDTTLKHVPAILMVTAYGHQLVLSEAGDISFQGVLLKPVTQSVIFNTLMHALVQDTGTQGEPQTPDFSDLGKYAEHLAGHRILVVDDNAINLDVACEFLSLVGVITETASNGLEAISRLEREPFDAVLMDVHMPVMNGLEAIRQIRKRPEWQRLPVIALTAQASVEDEMTSRNAGMSGHLTKPLDENLLYRTLANMLPRRDTAPSSVTAEPLPPSKVADHRLQDLSRRFGGSGRRLSRFLTGFLRDFATMSQDYAALEQSGSLTELADFAHRVKGVVGYVNATELYELSGQVENDARAGLHDAVIANSPRLHRLMQECVAGIQELIAQLPSEEAPAPSHGSPPELLARIEPILPLVQGGDFAARAPLEALIPALPEGALRTLATRALDLFDDLDLDAAAAALQELSAALSAPAGAP